MLYHWGGPRPCHGPAIGIRKAMPYPRHDTPHDNVLKLDGTTPRTGESMLCGSCKEPITSQWLTTEPNRGA